MTAGRYPKLWRWYGVVLVTVDRRRHGIALLRHEGRPAGRDQGVGIVRIVCHLAIFVQDPVSAGLLAAAVVFVAVSLWRNRSRALRSG